MKPEPPTSDPYEILTTWKPAPLPPETMERLRRACPAASESTQRLSPLRIPRFLAPVLAAAAAGAMAALYLYQPAAKSPPESANHAADAPKVSVTHSREWLSARELGSGVGEDGLPYRIVEGRWLDCSHIQIEGRPGVWTAATPAEGVTRVAMPVY